MPDIALIISKHEADEANMSERAVVFVERWIADNVSSENFMEDGGEARFDRLAQKALTAARASGLPESEIREEFPDLAMRMAEAVQGSADDELRRRIDDDA